MTKRSVEKLLAAGYVFLREREGKFDHAIMQSRKFGVWTKLESFATKAARTRRIRELEELNNYLVDL
jgi:hypothetical protein